MNLRRDEATVLAQICVQTARPEGPEMLLFPSHGWLSDVARCVTDSLVEMGGQDLSEYTAGAYTGEVSASMLKELGCKYALVGHSERRQLFGEDNARAAAKFVAARAAGLIPVLCLGESLQQREAGKAESVIAEQLDAVVALVGVAAFRQAIIAYEPVWAIGTGVTAATQDAQAIHAFIRSKLASQDAKIADFVRILYGGSVKPGNAADLFAQPDIDGGLIGGASLDAESFAAIYNAAHV